MHEANQSNQALTITFFGVSSLMFNDGVDRILTDGFFSRPDIWHTLFTPLRSDPELIERGLSSSQLPLRALLTAHAHHDHALDLVAISRQHEEAVLIGTPAVAALALAGDVPGERICASAHGDKFAFGAFQLRAINVQHGSSPWLLQLLLDHPMTDPPEGAAWFGDFKDDENRSWVIKHRNLTYLVHPSAGVLPEPIAADVVFLGLGQVGKMDPGEATDYFNSTLSSSVRLVIPIHWDQFTSSPGQLLQPAGWPFDDAEEGFRRLCHFLRDRPEITAVKLNAGEQVTVDADRLTQAGGYPQLLCPRPT